MSMIKRFFILSSFWVLSACMSATPTQIISETQAPTEIVESQNGVGSVSGQVTDETNTPIPYMFVQAKNNEGVIVSVLSNQDGEYQIIDLPSDTYTISAHRFGYKRSGTQTVEVKTMSNSSINFQLSIEADVASQVSGAEWLSVLPDDDETRQFILDCQGCHQLAWVRNLYKGWQTSSQWETSIKKMQGYYGPGTGFPIIGPMDAPHTSVWLAQYLTKDVTPPQPLPIQPEAQSVRITEYDFPGAGPHDLVLDANGQVIVTGMFSNDMYSLNPDTGEFTRYALTSNANPRALEIDSQGVWWIVFGTPHQVASFDPQTEELKTYSVGMYAHSIALDSNGNAWANGHFKADPGKVVMIDSQDGSRKTFDIPDNNTSNLTGLPISYDLRVDANDIVWGSDLNWNRIYKLDPQTGEVTHYELPNSTSGPRRFDFDNDGNLWIPEFSGGRLAMFNPVTETFTEWQPPTKNAEPYVVKVDKVRNIVWIGYAAANRVARFDVAAQTFTEYPLPTPFALIRHMAIDESNGDVWFSYHHVPTYQDMVVRLQVDL